MFRLRLARRSTAVTVVVLAWGGLLLAGCSGSSAPDAVSPSSMTPSVSSPASPSAAPERIVEVFLPPDAPGTDQPVPVVVLVPGGGWMSAIPAGMVPLAESLAESGSVAVTTTYRTEGDGATFPVPLEDVVCAVDEAVERVTAAGVTPGPVVVAGHWREPSSRPSLPWSVSSIGMAAPVRTSRSTVLSGWPVRTTCSPSPTSPPGSSTRPRLRTPPPGRPPTRWPRLGRGRDLPVLLLHGAADEGVSPTFSEDFSAALGSAGHPVTLVLLPEVDHSGIYQVDAAAGPIAEFLSTLTAR